MKNIIIVFFAIIMFSCNKDKRIIEKSDLIGTWKEMQRKAGKKSSAINVSECDGKVIGEIYTFNTDNLYIIKDNCVNNNTKQTGTWVYHDNVLSMIRDNTNWKYSVSDEGSNKVKLSIISAETNGKSNMDWFETESYIILEKQ